MTRTSCQHADGSEAGRADREQAGDYPVEAEGSDQDRAQDHAQQRKHEGEFLHRRFSRDGGALHLRAQLTLHRLSA